MGKVILSASGKGGVGKSVFIANMGAVLAERGLKIVMVDMNIGLRNLDLYAGVEGKVVYDVADVLSGACPLKKALVRDRRFPYLYVVPASSAREKFTAGPADVAALYADLRERYDFMLVDGPAGLGAELALAASGVDFAVIVTTLEYVSLRDADMTDRVLAKAGVVRRAYLINKVKKELMGSGLLPTLEDLSSVMRPPLLGIVQYDDNIHLAANGGVPIVAQKGSYIERNLGRIADRLLAMQG
ncbi:MAG: P-loop NTPase [Clostridiales Family XIII bacterium]|nr:P-loop NTPase [Clostridiales Family XIII bacterium]